MTFRLTAENAMHRFNPDAIHNVFIDGELKYQFEDSISYDTNNPAQWCIAQLREIKDRLPNVIIRSRGVEYRIQTLQELKHWTTHVFSPTPCSYFCDFSEYL
jgi:hypothetical protein